MTPLPETSERRWAAVRSVMLAGALLIRSPHDGLFYAEQVWGGFDDEAVQGLVRAGHIRPIGAAYRAGLWEPAEPTPLQGPYPAITLYQPWPALVSLQAKPWEFRARRAPRNYIGRRIAIHAAMRRIRLREVEYLMLRLKTHRASQHCLDTERALEVLERIARAPKAVPLGMVVCTAVLGQPVRAAALVETLSGASSDLGRSDPTDGGDWAWPLSQVEALPRPDPATGRQGWWRWRGCAPY